MGRLVLHWVCVFALVALPLGGCSDETTATGGIGGSGDTGGDGGTGGSGDGGTGGMPECESPDDCDDGNECTENACGDGMCEFAPVADGTACDESNECAVGTCADGACDSTLVADDTACGDDAGTCQQGSCRVACDEQGILDAIAAGGGPYTFACDGPTMVTTEAEIVIDNNVILDGEGNLTVDGDDDHRVFSVAEGVTAELRGFVVTNGAADSDSAGIFNQGALTMTNSTVSGNDGEGIFIVESTLTLAASTVSGNAGSGVLNEGGTVTVTESDVSQNGGGIRNENSDTFQGIVTLTESTVSENVATGCTTTLGFPCSVGGGIENSGILTLMNSTVSGNSSSAGGGGIFNEGTVTLTGGTVSGNTVAECTGFNDTPCSNGGGIFNSGTFTLTNTTVSGNTAHDEGGAVFAGAGRLSWTDTRVDGDCSIRDVVMVASNGGNIESPGDTCGFDHATDQVNVDP